MSRTHDLFETLKPPRKKRQVLMHIVDTDGGCALNIEDKVHVRMECLRCGHDSGWIFVHSVTTARRGLPCPNCNDAEAA